MNLYKLSNRVKNTVKLTVKHVIKQIKIYSLTDKTFTGHYVKGNTKI